MVWDVRLTYTIFHTFYRQFLYPFHTQITIYFSYLVYLSTQSYIYTKTTHYTQKTRTWLIHVHYACYMWVIINS